MTLITLRNRQRSLWTKKSLNEHNDELQYTIYIYNLTHVHTMKPLLT